MEVSELRLLAIEGETSTLSEEVKKDLKVLIEACHMLDFEIPSLSQDYLHIAKIFEERDCPVTFLDHFIGSMN